MQQPETNLKEGILPLDNTNRDETCSQTESETHVNVKSNKIKSKYCSSNSGDTRHWVVCHDGALKEVKVEPTDWTPDTRETSTCKNNDEVVNHRTNVRLFICDTCGESFTYPS